MVPMILIKAFKLLNTITATKNDGMSLNEVDKVDKVVCWFYLTVVSTSRSMGEVYKMTFTNMHGS